MLLWHLWSPSAAVAIDSVIYNVCPAIVQHLRCRCVESFGQLLRSCSFVLRIKEKRGERELRVFHARHKHALLTAVIYCFQGQTCRVLCTEYEPIRLNCNPVSASTVSRIKGISCVSYHRHAALSSGFPVWLCLTPQTRFTDGLTFGVSCV